METEKTWLVMPDGSVVWEPDEDDFETWREEWIDLYYD